MARNSQFLTMLSMLRNEVGRSNQAGSAGVADFGQLKQILNRHYEFLYTDYDWPHLRKWFDRITLSAGERYYDFPATLDYERIDTAVVWENGIPRPLERGITAEDYAAYASEDGARGGPVLKWEVTYTNTKEQAEVWPMPSSNTPALQFRGVIKFNRLINGSDLCRLDDQLVVGFAAAEIAAGQKSEDAPLKLKSAQALYDRLRGRTKGASKVHTFGEYSGSQRFNVVVNVK